MHTAYDDIRSRITESPSWWDENGVPRYGEFDPNNRSNIYSDECVLLLISSQACFREFQVCFSAKGSTLAELTRNKELHYGDPPNACNGGCVGASMNSVPERVLQYWQRPLRIEGKLKLEWVRDQTLKVDVTPSWV